MIQYCEVDSFSSPDLDKKIGNQNYFLCDVYIVISLKGLRHFLVYVVAKKLA